MARKPDFPPLLPPGYHSFDLEGIKRLCVDPYPACQGRRYLFFHLEQLIQDLLFLGIRCEVWVDGSFLTEHPDPGDLDLLIRLDYDVANSLTNEQHRFIETLSEGTYNSRIDSWVLTCIPREHPLFLEGGDERYELVRLYNVEHGEVWLKGVAVLKVGETDVGLRICS